MNTKRNHGINLLKFIAVLGIILIHDKLPGNAGTLIRGMAATAVPIFFLISGYYSYLTNEQVIARRARRIFWLMLVANGIYFIWDICVEILMGNSVKNWFLETCSPKKILVWLLTNESSLRGHLWFLGALFYSYLFMLVILKVKKHRNISDKVLLGMAVLLLCGNILGGEILTQLGKNIQIPYIRNWLFCGVPFFLIGYCIHGWQLTKQTVLVPKKYQKFFLLILLFNFMEVMVTAASELYCTSIFMAVAAFVLALTMEERANHRWIVALGNTADKYGLWIYILQIMVIKTIQYVEQMFGIENIIAIQWISPIVSFLITLGLACITVRLSEKA